MPVPADGSDTMKISVQVKWTTLLASGSTGICIDFALADDGRATSAALPAESCRLQIRQDGRLGLYRNDTGTGALLASELAMDAMVLDTHVPLVITMTSTDVTVERTDTTDSISVADATYRGGYFQFVRNGDGVAAFSDCDTL